jgi:DNA-binding winged helix-turn-helix (wHTH) protein
MQEHGDHIPGEGRPGFSEIVEFGPFCLRAAERLLERDGVPISLGSRALDILIALVERPSEVVGKRDLIARVWPNLVVDEGSLRFHIAGLRKALGDGQSSVRYVTNVAGRGYCFVAPVSRGTSRHQFPSTAFDRSYGLLSPLERQILRGLAVFAGAFSLEAVQAIVALDAGNVQLSATVAALVAKSFVVADTAAANKSYRLPETTRAYLLAKLTESGELHLMACRHAIYCIDLLERSRAEPPLRCKDESLALYADHLRDVREALQWSFSEQGDIGIGTRLAVASSPIFSKSPLRLTGSQSGCAAGLTQ